MRDKEGYRRLAARSGAETGPGRVLAVDVLVAIVLDALWVVGTLFTGVFLAAVVLAVMDDGHVDWFW